MIPLSEPLKLEGFRERAAKDLVPNFLKAYFYSPSYPPPSPTPFGMQASLSVESDAPSLSERERALAYPLGALLIF